MPGGIPISGRRVFLQIAEAADQRPGRSVARHNLDRRFERAKRIIPSPLAVGGKPLQISLAQGRLLRAEFALASHDFVDDLRARLALYHDAIDLANLQ